MTLPSSLTFRLAATSALWVIGTLLAVGLLLIYLFRDHIERRFDAQLGDHMEELVAASEIALDKKFRLTWTPTDPRFHRPYSGWYWQIMQEGKSLQHSKSLWKDVLPVGQGPLIPGAPIEIISGPGGGKLRALKRLITLPESDQNFIFVIAGPVTNIEQDVALFTRQLVLTLGLLALALLAAIILQVRFGLRPLRALRREISKIRSGEKQRAPTAVPTEVLPVVSELNALLDHNSEMLEKARAQAANLAHALKNPLTVMSLEAGEIKGERGKILKDQTRIVKRHIERHLSRAQAAGARRSGNLKTPLSPILDDLQFSMQLLHKDRALDCVHTGFGELSFRGDAHDMEEMLGNLFDNACKWARSRVKLTVATVDSGLQLVVEDDGPGIDAKLRDRILKRGIRADSVVDGHGLGLAMVRELVSLYGGHLRIEASVPQGTRFSVFLPNPDTSSDQKKQP